MLTPPVGSGDDDTVGKTALALLGSELLARRCEKRVDVGVLQGLAWVKKFALDGPVVARAALACYQVNPYVGAPTVGPFFPQPDISKAARHCICHTCPDRLKAIGRLDQVIPHYDFH